ncbi:hypothetical protein FNYG_13569 [Fusarium nygamai]|uniref:Protein kinase domain-containing protein n=1 Tax=Gibberella nygamai TaxID=42673 RepID=A0A2K0UVB4_GIBNY|nr:hypothetical protein FNYG_13569 [Fusarium nygamai]
MDMKDISTRLSLSIESALQRDLDHGFQNIRPQDPYNSCSLRNFDISTLEEAIRTSADDPAEPRQNSGGAIEYAHFLRNLSLLPIKCIPPEDIKKSSTEAYGSGAMMTVYPGVWRRAHAGRTELKVVALKYCNSRAPQGATSLQEVTDDISSRLKAILQELKVMSGRTGRYYKYFPRVYALCWEEIKSPAGISLYQPIIVVEAALSNLENYVRSGQLGNYTTRHEEELRFITSIQSAMNYLHEESGLIHGDLKPSNVLVFVDHQALEVDVKLADFGFTYDIFRVRADGSISRGAPPGLTPYWSAPETYPDEISWSSRRHRYTSDYYSFGLLVWFILFGYPVGDLKEGLSKADLEAFKEIKQGVPQDIASSLNQYREDPDKFKTCLDKLELNAPFPRSLHEMITEAFDSRWCWQVADKARIWELDEAEDSEERGKVMESLMSNGVIKQLEWNQESSEWIPTKRMLHHVFRAFMETGLRRQSSERICIVHKPSDTILTPEISYQLASYYVTGYADATAAVFGATDSERHERSIDREHYHRAANSHELLKVETLPLRKSLVSLLPENLAKELLAELISSAKKEDEERQVRYSNAVSILAFEDRFQNITDFKFWAKEAAFLGPGRAKVWYAVEQSLEGHQLDEDEQTELILEGITELPGEDIDQNLRQVFKEIDRDLMRIPMRCALWDYVSDMDIHDSPTRDYHGQSMSPVFEAVLDGDLGKFKRELSNQQQSLPSLKFDGYNLLHFAILMKQPEIIRLLMLEHGFSITEDDGGIQAMDTVLQEPHAIILHEIEAILRLIANDDARRHSFFEDRKLPDEPILTLFRPDRLAFIAERGSQAALKSIHLKHKDPGYPSPNIMHIGWLDELGDDKELFNPLFAALKTRRLTAFLRFLQWGKQHNKTFSPDAELPGGASILAIAIRSLAPLFVAALLAYGANPNKAVSVNGSPLSPLAIACSSPGKAYIESLEHRQELHKELGLPDFVLEQDDIALTCSSEDSKALRQLIVELLLCHGADINFGADKDQSANAQTAQDEHLGLTPLAWCVQTKREDLAIYLVKKGADPNLKSGLTAPILMAINANLDTLAAVLLEHGASPNTALLDSSPVLLLALARGKTAIFESLLQNGARLDTPVPASDDAIVFHVLLDLLSEADSDSTIPISADTLGLAGMTQDQLIQNWTQQCKILTTHLAQTNLAELQRIVNIQSPPFGSTAIHEVAKHVCGSSAQDRELMRLVVANTTNLKAEVTGYTPHDIAIAKGNLAFVEVIKPFLQKGPSVKQRTNTRLFRWIRHHIGQEKNENKNKKYN